MNNDLKISCKEAFANELLEMAKVDKRIMVLCSDSKGSSNLVKYSNELPQQYVECGIAEQNEIGIAAGLALQGLHPYVSAPACFLTTRSLEQLKLDVGYSNLNVKILGVSGGISYGALGTSHHTMHDIATLRSLGGIDVYIPSGPVQTLAILHHIEKTDRPAYIRVGKRALSPIYENYKSAFTYGKANTVRDGDDITIVACGEMVYEAIAAADELKKQSVNVRVLDVPSLAPFDREAIIKAAKETKHIISIEEHCVNGGLGAAVSQTVVENCPVKMKIMGYPRGSVKNGNEMDVKNYYQLNKEGLILEIKNLLKAE